MFPEILKKWTQSNNSVNQQYDKFKPTTDKVENVPWNSQKMNSQIHSKN